MKIVITIDERGNPKVEIVKEDPKVEAVDTTEVKEDPKVETFDTADVAKKADSLCDRLVRLNKHFPDEVKKDPIEEIKDIVKDNKPDYRENYSFETLKEHSRVLPVFRVCYKHRMRVHRPLVRWGFVSGWREFLNFYNSGWIIFGVENPYENIDIRSCDISFFYSCVAWKDELRNEGYLLVEIRGTFIILHIRRNI